MYCTGTLVFCVHGLKKAVSMASCQAPPQPRVVTGFSAASAACPASISREELRRADPAVTCPKRRRKLRRSRCLVSSRTWRSVSSANSVSLSAMFLLLLLPPEWIGRVESPLALHSNFCGAGAAARQYHRHEAEDRKRGDRGGRSRE